MKNQKKHYVYLSGPITADVATFQWREELEQMVEERNLRIAVINPCRSKFDQSIYAKLKTGEPVNFLEEAKKIPTGVLKRKDRQQVMISSLIVVNLAIQDKQKPTVGTIYELAWADEKHLPVIAIVDEKNPGLAAHPFAKDSISERVASVKEAVDLIDMFFIDV